MAKFDRDYVPPALVECQTSWGFTTGRASKAELAQQNAIYELSHPAGYCCPGQASLTGDLGPTGSAPVRDQFEGGAEVAASGVVLGGLGVPGGEHVRIALFVTSHGISSPSYRR